MLTQYAEADCIKIKSCDTCGKYSLLCAYVGQFTLGGFWFSINGLHFVTNGLSSDKEASYEDAKQFLAERM